MAWEDHPQKLRGQLMIHRPAPLKTALVNEGGGITYPITELDYDNEAGDTFNDWGSNVHYQQYCMVTFGDAPRGMEKGRTVNIGTSDSTNVLYLPNTPRGVRVGELNIADNDYLTWWDSYKPWFLSPRYFYTGGTLYYHKKGRFHQKSFFPQINMGPPFFGVAGASGYVDVPFSYADSLNFNHACYTSGTDTTVGTDYSSSSESGGNIDDNVADNSAVTYWQTTGNTDEWIEFDYGSAPGVQLSYYSVNCQVSSTAWATWRVQYSDDQVTYTDVAWEAQATWTSGKYYFFLPDNIGSHRYWRFYLDTANGGASFQTHEMELFWDRPSVTNYYNWNIEDGSYAVGSAGVSDIEARFYPGFRHVHMGAYYGLISQMFVGHRPVCVLDTSQWWASKGGITPSVSGGGGGAFLIDGDTGTGWTLGAPPAWAQFVFPTWIELTGMKIAATGLTSPNDFVLQYYDPLTASWIDVAVGVDVDNWSGASIEWNEYTFDKPAFADTFRIYVTSTNGGANAGIREVDFKYRRPYGFCIEQAIIQSHEMTPEGQTMQFRIYEDISDFPPRALVMFRGDEYYAGVKGSLTAADPTAMDREGMFFVGWIDETRTRIQRNRDGRIAYTDITVLDLAHWMQRFPGVTQAGARQKDLNTTGPFTTGITYNLDNIHYLNIDRMIWYLGFYDAINFELADLYGSDTWEKYAFPVNQASGGNIYRNMDGRAQTIAHRVTFNKMGQYHVKPDPILQAAADRTTEVQMILGPEDIESINWSSLQGTRIGRHWADAQQRSHEGYTGTNKTDPLNLVGFACVSPDQDVWGQGAGELDQGNQLVIDQNELNTREGQRYAARSNPDTSFIDVTLKHGGDNGADPARMSWVEMDLAAHWRRLRDVASANLLGLWWLNETGGSTAEDDSDNGFDGTLTSVLLNQSLGPDYEPAPYFNGSAYIDIYSAGLGSAFDETAGTVSIWAAINEAALGDSSDYVMFALFADSSNYILLYKTSTANTINLTYRAGGTSKNVSLTVSDSQWHHYMLTWDTGADEVKGYFDGVLQNTLDTLGSWSGALTAAYIGTYDTTNYRFKGRLALTALFDTPLTAANAVLLAQDDAIRGPDGEQFAGERFLLVKKTIAYQHDKMSRKTVLTLEREVNGVAADTWVKPA